jgi:hypothetical protein
MRINYKFHTIAIAIISAVIVVIFLLFGPKAPPSAAPVVLTTADSYARIVSATWGLNCNVFIESAIAVQAKEGLARDANGTVIAAPILKKVTPDNVLEKVKALCNGKPFCETYINSEILGNEPSADCFKQLEISYRCFEVDRLRSASVGQNDALKIDCTNPTADTHAPAKGK